MANEKEFDDSEIVIDGHEAAYRINAEGRINGKYIGTFKFRCFLTPTQLIAANRDYRESLGGNPTLVAEHEDNLAYALAQLKYRVVSYPPFWAGEHISVPGDIADPEIITLVLDAAIAAELKYLRKLKEDKTSAIEKAKAAAERIYAAQAAESKREIDEANESKNTQDTDKS